MNKTKDVVSINFSKRITASKIIDWIKELHELEDKDFITYLACEGAKNIVNGYYSEEHYSIETKDTRFEIVIPLK